MSEEGEVFNPSSLQADGEGALAGWDESKENLQPVKSGRSAKAFKNAFDIVSGDREKAREAVKRNEEQIR